MFKMTRSIFFLSKHLDEICYDRGFKIISFHTNSAPIRVSWIYTIDDLLQILNKYPLIVVIFMYRSSFAFLLNRIFIEFSRISIEHTYHLLQSEFEYRKMFSKLKSIINFQSNFYKFYFLNSLIRVYKIYNFSL